MAAPMLTLSVIIPTRNEAANVARLIDTLTGTLAGISYELIFVDDSTDATSSLIEARAAQDPRVRCHHRSVRGLGTAVAEGFSLAHGRVIAVLDADFQHPPDLLRPMLAAIESGADLVIPSRFIEGGSDGGLAWPRKLVSLVARSLGKAALRALRPISDPTGGLFMLRACVIKGVGFQPRSWKILAEVLVRGHYSQVVEIPYRFSERAGGTSKLDWRESLNYLVHVLHLALDSPRDRRFFVFALVGSSGFVVDVGVYALALHFQAPVVASGFFSALCAMAWNFTWNDLVTWRTSHHVHVSVRAVKYAAVSLAGIAISTSALALAYQSLHFHPLAAKLLGISLAVTWNYLLNSRWTWRERNAQQVVVARRAS
jgi:dolichol-phosphate mannosyltransferase